MPKHALPKTGPHGIDLTAPGGIAALLNHHRATFGNARMEVPGEGGQGGEGGAGGEQGGQQSSAGQQSGQQGGEQPGAAGSGEAGQQGEQEKVEDLPDWAQRIIRETRGEAAGNRTKATEAEQKYQTTLEGIAKALGLKGEDEQPDPAALTEQLTASQQQAREAAVELAVYKAASTHQGDPQSLLDSRAFLAKVKDLDPSADDFADKVGSAIKTAVADNPKLKAARAVGKSGVEHAGGTGDTSRKPQTLGQSVSAHYGT